MIGAEPEQVPHFNDMSLEEDERVDVDAWLRANVECEVVTIVYPGEFSLDEILATMGCNSSTAPYIISGRSGNPKFDCNHAVVGIGGELFCDPKTGKEPDPKTVFRGPVVNDNLSKDKQEEQWWVTYLVRSAPIDDHAIGGTKKLPYHIGTCGPVSEFNNPSLLTDDSSK